MKILHILNVKNIAGNGVTEAVKQYVEHENRYADVSLWCIDGQLAIPGIKTYTNDHKTISAIIDDNKPDLIIFNEVYKKEYLKAYKECLKNNIPFVIIPHGCLVDASQHEKRLKKKLANLFLFGKFIKSATAIQFLNEQEKTSTHLKYKKAIISGNGTSKKTKIANNPTNKKIIYIGRYDIKVKGLDLLIDTCAKHAEWLHDNKIVFELYGRDSVDTREELINLIKTSNASEIIHVNSEVYGKNKEKALLEAYAFIQTSRHEGQPMSIIEALSYGVPCIVTKGTSFAEYINKNRCGFGCNFNQEEIFEKIQELCLNKKLRNSFSRNAIVAIKKDYLQDNVIQNTIRQYKELI